MIRRGRPNANVRRRHMAQANVYIFLLAAVVFSYNEAASQNQHRRSGGRVIVADPDIPVTTFSCKNRTPGYYADLETGCQVYHMCTEGGTQFSYRCPNTTLFQQRMLICAHWYQVNCSRSEQHYNANLLIGQRDKPFVDESEQVNIYFNGKDIKGLLNPDDLQKLHYTKPTTNKNFQLPVTEHLNTVERVSSFQQPQRNNFFVYQSTTPVTQRIALPVTPSSVNHQNFQSDGIAHFTVNPNPTPPAFLHFTKQFNHQTNPPLSTQSPFSRLPDRSIQNTQDQQIFQNPTTPNTYTQDIQTSVNLPRNLNLNYNKTFANIQPVQEVNQKSEYNENSYNNFVRRFIPDAEVNKPIVDNSNNNSDISQMYTNYNQFLAIFVPENENLNLSSNARKSNFQHPQISAGNLMQKINLLTKDLEPPFESPSSNLELPFEDAEQVESSNVLKLQFQDPRRVFYIPESDYEQVSLDSELTPITITIERPSSSKPHPMMFLNSVPETCYKCHPSFIINKAACTPCVVIR